MGYSFVCACMCIGYFSTFTLILLGNLCLIYFTVVDYSVFHHQNVSYVPKQISTGEFKDDNEN